MPGMSVKEEVSILDSPFSLSVGLLRNTSVGLTLHFLFIIQEVK